MNLLSKRIVFCFAIFFTELLSAQGTKEVKEVEKTEELKALTEYDIAQKLFGWSDEKVEQSKLMQQIVFEKYTNLSKAKKTQYTNLLKKGNKSIESNFFADAYTSYIKAELISEGDYYLESKLAVSCIELRLFDEAEKYLLSALFKRPANIFLNYNLGEKHFVTRNFDKSLERFLRVQKLIEFNKSEAVRLKRKVVKNNLGFNITDFVNFKLQLCYLGLMEKQQAASEEFLTYKAKYKELNDKFSKRAFTPLYYYSVALNFLKEGNKIEAFKWIKQSNTVFTDKSIGNSYIDALAEFGLLDSYYGGNK